MTRRKLRKVDVPELVRHALLAWLFAVTLEYLLLPGNLRTLAGLDGLAQMSFGRVMIITCAGTLILTLACRFKDTSKQEKWSMLAVTVVLIALAVVASVTMAFMWLCMLLLTAVVIYLMFGWDRSPEPGQSKEKTHWIYGTVTAVLALGFFTFVCVWTVSRVRSFCAPTYDYGIFSQMFYNMEKTGLPMTTVERDGLLSHFDVHVSPIYYLMLPFYMIAPGPYTLQVLQAAVMASAVIPLWLIGKRHGLSGLQRTLLCGVLLLYPAFSGAAGYDIHENCFLTPCILWLFYGIDRKSSLITGIGAVLTLLVKEDAAVYVAVIALWLIVKTALKYRRSDLKQLLTGIVLLIGALGWFLAVTGHLANNGDGVMTYRYENFMYDESGSLVSVVKAVLMNPMKAFYECVETEKLEFIAQTLLPLLCLPLITRRFERYILLIPYILVNLMTDYQYQHDIFYQYTFGSTACLIYLTAINLADFKAHAWRIVALVGAVLVAGSFFLKLNVPKAQYYTDICQTYQEYYDGVREALKKVPDDVSVTANTYYTPYLARRDLLYDIRYCSKAHILETEYVVLKVNTSDYKRFNTGGKENGYENIVAFLEENGYEAYYQHGSVLTIYKKAE